jgi:molybdopterin-guanine dinucleotide biosynthesis protein
VAIVVIGGHSRNVGKTSVVAGLIASLPEFAWTAIKITQFGHGVCSVTSEPCDCALNETEHAWSVDEEMSTAADTDTSRFKAAGAQRVYWVRTKQGQLALAMPRVREVLAEAHNVIIESNSVMKFVRPELYLPVLDFATEDFKDSAREFLDRAGAVILHANNADPRWMNISLRLIAGKPVFRITPPEYVTPEITGFVRGKIARAVPQRV